MKFSRKQIIILSLVLLALVIAVIAIFYMRADSGPKSGTVEAAPYKIAWERQTWKKLKVEIIGELPSNCEWAISANEGIINVTQQDNSAVFTVKAVNEGTGVVTIRARESGIPVDKGVDFEFRFSINDKKRIEFESCSAKVLDVNSIETKDGTDVYWKNGNAGSIFLYIKGTDWNVSSRENVGCAGPTADGDMMRIEVYGLNDAAEGRLVLIDSNTNKGYEFSFTQSGGILDLKDCVETEAVEETTEELVDPEYQAAQDAIEKAETDEEKDRIKAEYWLSQSGKFAADAQPSAESEEN